MSWGEFHARYRAALADAGLLERDPEPDADGLVPNSLYGLLGRSSLAVPDRVTPDVAQRSRLGRAIGGGFGDGGLAGIISPKRALTIPLRRGASDPDLLARAV